MKLQEPMVSRVASVLLMMGLFMGLVSCQAYSQPFWKKTNQFWLAFVDASKSTLQDRENYKSYLKTTVDQLKPGDRFLVGRIHDETMTNFVPVIDVTLPGYNQILDNEFAYDKQFTAIKNRLKASIDSLAAILGQSDKTEILDCFKVAEDYFRYWPSKKTLVILSDMLECSRVLDLEKLMPDAAFIAEKLQSLEKEGRIAKLDNVEIFIAGAGGRNTHDSKHYLGVKNFWRAFIAKTGAQLVSYSHTLILAALEN